MYAPHRIIPHQVKYSTALTKIAETCRLIPSPIMWLEVGIVGRFLEIIAYMCVGTVSYDSIWLVA